MAKPTILVVDDEVAFLFGIECIIRNMGYSCYTAVNGLFAMDKYRDHEDEIEIVLLDLKMPVMNGIDLFHKLRSKNKNLKFIISSSSSELDEIQELMDKGASYFLPKPYSQSKLQEALKKVEKIKVSD